MGTFFISEELLVNLHINYTTLSKSIRKQMVDNKLSHSLVSTSETAAISLKGTLLGTVVLNIAVKGALNLILSLINSLQLIIHLPLINIVCPPNVIAMF